MEAELQIYADLITTIVKYLIPVLAVNFLTDIASRFVPENKQFQMIPVICVFFALLLGSLYGYIEEDSFKDTIEHILSILTISGVLFISGAYKAIKNRLIKIISKDKENV